MNDQLKARYTPKEQGVVKLTRQLTLARYTACGRFLLTSGYDGLVRRFNGTIEEPAEIPPLRGHQGWVHRIAFPASFEKPNEWVVSADSWGQLRCSLFENVAADPRWVQTDAHDGWILDLATSPNGQLVATCGIDRFVRIWSIADGTKVCEFRNADAEVLSVAFDPDNASVIAGDLLGKVTQWDLSSGKVARELDAKILHKTDRLQEVGGVRKIVFAPDKQSLICTGTKPKGGGNVQGVPTILVFDWGSGKVRKTFEFGQDSDVYVTDLAFHPAGFVMGTISGNPGVGKLIFFRLEDDAPFFETTKMANCQSVALHPNLQQLAVVATNTGSNGNGRPLNKEGSYQNNFSPIHIWKFPDPPQS